MMPKLNILILTHKRPNLFTRCLTSVLAQITPDIEVIVNNDSDDITEIRHPQISYHYQKFDNISSIYEFLFLQSTGEYVYYLEDDDYLTKGFTDIILDADIIAGNYYPTYNPPYLLDCTTLYSENRPKVSDFCSNLNLEHLQLSQYIFKKTCIDSFEYIKDNNVHNDIRLVLHAATHSSSIKTISKIMFYQTIDGDDNLSFPETTSLISITKDLNFLKKYNLDGDS
jgi:glycosyltransferase involved in cell wall biosynthesis